MTNNVVRRWKQKNMVKSAVFFITLIHLFNLYINEGWCKKEKRKSKNGAAVTIQDQNVFLGFLVLAFVQYWGKFVYKSLLVISSNLMDVKQK